MKKKQILSFGAIILFVTLGIVFFFIWKTNAPITKVGMKTIDIHVDHLEGEDSDFTVSTNGEYLIDALSEIDGFVEGQIGEYGLYIDTIDGEMIDSNNQEWWGYTVNGELAVYGVDQQVIEDGDKVVFTLNVGY